MTKKYFAMTIIAASVALAACSDDDDDDDDGMNPVVGMPTPGGEEMPVEMEATASPAADISLTIRRLMMYWPTRQITRL